MKDSVNNNTVSSVQEVKLSQIVASSYNQRKTFDEQTLKDLSDSILQHGVLQPVLLRKIGKTKYEIVYGERRYRAAKLAGLSTIPANIRVLTDEQAFEISVIENLQRENIKPMEEAAGFVALLETKKYDYTALAQKIGKSVAYVRNRVKLNDLISEVAQMIDNEELNIGIGLIMATYSEDIQQDAFINHLKVKSGYSWWGNLSTTEYKKYMENNYSLLLENYPFEQSDCVNCPHNTNTYSIFPEGTGKCTKRTCLIEKNGKYLFSEAMSLANEQNIRYVRVDHSNNINDSIFVAFENEGLIFPQWLFSVYYPEAPKEPNREDFYSDDGYQSAMEDFYADCDEYEAEKADFDTQLAEGSIAKGIHIKQNQVMVIYLQEKIQPIKSHQDDDDNDNVTDSNHPEAEEIPEKPVIANNHSVKIRALKQQDKRNKEIAVENILNDAKEILKNIPEYTGELSDLEIKMMYFFMMPTMSREKERLLIPGDYATSSDRLKFVENLTNENLSLIVREYLRVNFKQQTCQGSELTDLFLAFARQHCPEQLDEISQKYNDVYERRKQRIDAELAGLLPPESEPYVSVEATEQLSDEQPSEQETPTTEPGLSVVVAEHETPDEQSVLLSDEDEPMSKVA